MRYLPALAVLVVLCVLPAWAVTAAEEAKLLTSDGALGDWFGFAVALDGNTAVIGAYHDDVAGSNSGSAYVFTRSGGVWTEQAKLVPSDGETDDHFGYAVALDGDYTIIGAPWDSNNGNHSGSVYAFARAGSAWTQKAKLLPIHGAAEDGFGTSVALDGHTALIGAWGDDDNGWTSGSAYVFTRAGLVWTEQAKLLPADGASHDHFGARLVLDGDTAVIGAPMTDNSASNSGSAYVFTRMGNVWTEQAELLASDGAASHYLGSAVALDGDTAVIGAYGDDDNGYNSGSAYVFTRSGGVWTEQAKLVPVDGAAYDEFGCGVAVDGDVAIIGAWRDRDNGWYSGSAYVFSRVGGVWNLYLKLLPTDGATGDWFGYPPALDGDVAIIGAHKNDDNGGDSGSAYVFRLIPPDADGDGINDEADFCPDTTIPESVPTNQLQVNRWALVDDDDVFDTTPPPGGGGGPDFTFTVADTGGCSCAQIIERWALGWGHTKFGCSTGVMLQWIAYVGDYSLAQIENAPGPITPGALQTPVVSSEKPSASAQGTVSDPDSRRGQSITPRRTPRRHTDRN